MISHIVLTQTILHSMKKGAIFMAKESSTSLRKGRLGVAGIVFFVVAASAPLVGMTGAVPVAMLLGNGAALTPEHSLPT